MMLESPWGENSVLSGKVFSCVGFKEKMLNSQVKPCPFHRLIMGDRNTLNIKGKLNGRNSCGK